MPFTPVAENMGEYVLLTTTGTLESVAEVNEYVESIRKETLCRNLRRVLIDERGLKEIQDTQEVHEVCEAEPTAQIALSGIRVACLSSPESYDLNKDYETFLTNRSMNFKVFLDNDEAVAWLTS